MLISKKVGISIFMLYYENGTQYSVSYYAIHVNGAWYKADNGNALRSRLEELYLLYR